VTVNSVSDATLNGSVRLVMMFLPLLTQVS
jgi:hypothetical protein